MKVLKSGSGQQGWAKECTCTGAGNGNAGCGAVLLVEQRDLFKTHSSARDEVTTYITFECPECKQWTDIQSGYGRSVVPHHVTKTLTSRVPGRVYADGR